MERYVFLNTFANVMSIRGSALLILNDNKLLSASTFNKLVAVVSSYS